MSGYTDAIGGAPIGVAGGSYTAFSMAANVTLQWPQYAVSGGQPFARLMDVTPTAQNLTVQLPDATLASQGEACIVNNKGSSAMSVLDGGGNVLAVMQPSDVRYLYLMDTSTAAGLWSTILFGKTNSSQDASQFAGPGLKAINNTLAWAPITTLVNASATLDTTSRSKVLVWTGGVGTLTLPDLATVGNDFAFELRNQGSGVCTLAAAGGQTIDASASIGTNANEAFIVHSNSAGWYTVGRGRQTQFAFTQLVKNVAGGGGTTTLSLSEASSVVQSYIGALSGAQTVVLPAVVQVYYVANQTTGGNNITFKCPGNGGNTIQLAPGQNAILFADGTTVINANTTTAGLSALILGAGSPGAPPVQIGSAGNGFYAPGTNQIGLALNGAGVTVWDSAGPRFTGASPTLQVVGSSGAATMVVDRVAGQTGSLRFRTAGVDRFSWSVTNSPEIGLNVGSDLSLDSYSDAGVQGSVMSVTRSTRQVIFTFLPFAAGSTMMTTAATQTVTNKTIDGGFNTFRNIPASAISGTVPGPAGTVDLSSVQTLTNKTLSGLNNSFDNIPLNAVPGAAAHGEAAAKGDNSDITTLRALTTIHGDITILRDSNNGQGVLTIGNRSIVNDATNVNTNGNWIFLGNVTVNGLFSNPSDERLKKDWVSVGENFVEKLSLVRAGSFTKKSDDTRHIGVSAQSLRAVLPQAIVEDEEGYLAVQYGNAALVACVELAKEVQRLKTIVDNM